MIALKSLLFAYICVLALPSLNAFVEWNSLKATWCPPTSKNVNYFQDIPRTVKLALNSGWRKALKSELFANPNPYKFDEVPDFLDNSIESHSIYSTTAYFVNPTDICSNGRTDRQLELQGTASRQYFQTGETPNQLRAIPLYRSVASQHYTSTNCVDSMGHHNHYEVSKIRDSYCTKIIPSFLLFNNMGELHGFGKLTVARLSSPRLEHPNKYAVKIGLDPITPECMEDIADSPSLPGFSNIHFFFGNAPKDFKCGLIGQTAADGSSKYINPNFSSNISTEGAGNVFTCLCTVKCTLYHCFVTLQMNLRRIGM